MDGTESSLAKALQESPMAYLGLRRRLPDGTDLEPPVVLNNVPGDSIHHHLCRINFPTSAFT